MQLAGSGNGTPPCHRPITEHAGGGWKQLPSNGNCRAVWGKKQGGRGLTGSGGSSGSGAGGGEAERPEPAAVHNHSATDSSNDTLPPLPSNSTPLLHSPLPQDALIQTGK